MIFAFFSIFLRFNNNKKIPQKKNKSTRIFLKLYLTRSILRNNLIQTRLFPHCDFCSRSLDVPYYFPLQQKAIPRIFFLISFFTHLLTEFRRSCRKIICLVPSRPRHMIALRARLAFVADRAQLGAGPDEVFRPGPPSYPSGH